MSNMHDFQYDRSDWTNADLVTDEPELATGDTSDPDEGPDADGALIESEDDGVDELEDDDDDGGLFADDKPAPKKRGPKPKGHRH